MLRDCPIDHRCMTAITPDDVFQRSATMLAGNSSFASFESGEKVRLA
jgi:hypothetical protein